MRAVGVRGPARAERHRHLPGLQGPPQVRGCQGGLLRGYGGRKGQQEPGRPLRIDLLEQNGLKSFNKVHIYQNKIVIFWF